MSAPVLVERRGAVLVMTLNRPAQRNAVNRAVSLAMAAALDTLDADPDLRVGIVAGSGGSFCRVGYVYDVDPGGRSSGIGFRLIRRYK